MAVEPVLEEQHGLVAQKEVPAGELLLKVQGLLCQNIMFLLVNEIVRICVGAKGGRLSIIQLTGGMWRIQGNVAILLE